MLKFVQFKQIHHSHTTTKKMSNLIHTRTTRTRTILLVLFLLQVLIVVLTVNASNFGTLYTTTSKSASYSFSGATSSCSLTLTIDRNSTQSLSFTLSKYPVSGYTNRVPDNAHTLLGVYGISVNDYGMNTNDTQLTYYFTCPNGILNVKPQNMGIFTLAPVNYFLDTGASPISPTTISYSVKLSAKSAGSTIGFLAVVDSGSANIGYYNYFYGPYQFKYNIATNNYGQVTETLNYQLPNVLPTFDSYAFALSNTQISYQSNDYTTLYSYKITKVSNPNGYGANLQYNFQYGNNFKDMNGNSIIIQKSSLSCICSTDGYTSLSVSSSYTSTSLTCNYINSACQYISIIAKTIPSESSPNPSTSTAIQMYQGVYVYTGVITKKYYYKINVPSYNTLKLKSISLKSSSDGSGYVTINSESTSYTSEKVYVYSSSQFSSLSYTNYNSYTKTIYVTVEPYLSETSIEFYPSITSAATGYGNGFPVYIIFAIAGPLFMVFSIVVVIVTIKKNSRQPHEQQI